jgi:GAF domain-containing protein
LRRWGEPFECDGPIHPLRAALLVPMTARTHLVGFIVCGPKRDRTHYLPEEIETVTALAHRVGSAYGWLTMSAQASIPQPSFDTSG